jgi:EF hand domain-containing protein
MHRILIAAAALTALAAGGAIAQDSQGGGHFGQMLAMADANHDGVITRAEFDAARAARFTQLDADHNGALSTSERPQWGGARPAGTAERPRGDANADGSVSRAEWDAEGAHMFARLDANNDGAISQAELQAAQARMQAMRR